MGRKCYRVFFVGLLLLLSSPVLACAVPTSTQTPTISMQSSPIARPVSSPLTEKPAITTAEAKCVLAVDGDTIEVLINGESYNVRYIGINTPETVHPSKPVEYFGKEASDNNRDLVQGKTVRLEKDISETDKYDRLLRYVWVGDMMINAELVRLGYAQVSTYPPDVKYQDLFLKLQKEAREASRGLWATPEPPKTTTIPSSSTTKCSGATAICNDGTCSYSEHRSGTCSHHGGVSIWLNRPPN